MSIRPPSMLGTSGCCLKRLATLVMGPIASSVPSPGLERIVSAMNWTAVQFMADTIRSNPGEGTLLAIGPMTNVASLFRQHPEVPSMLGGLMLMSGRYGPKPADAHANHEWNVYCDP